MADMRRRRQEILIMNSSSSSNNNSGNGATPGRSSSPRTAEKGRRSTSPSSRGTGTAPKSRSPSPSSKTTSLNLAGGETKPIPPVVTQEEYEQLRKLKAACHRRIG